MTTDTTIILEALKESPKFRDELVVETSIPRTTIYDALKKMVVLEEVEWKETYKDGRGRPRVLFGLTGRYNGYWKRLVPNKKRVAVMDALENLGELSMDEICNYLGTKPCDTNHVLNRLLQLGFVLQVKKRFGRGRKKSYYSITKRGVDNRINYGTHEPVP